MCCCHSCQVGLLNGVLVLSTGFCNFSTSFHALFSRFRFAYAHPAELEFCLLTRRQCSAFPVTALQACNALSQLSASFETSSTRPTFRRQIRTLTFKACFDSDNNNNNLCVIMVNLPTHVSGEKETKVFSTEL